MIIAHRQDIAKRGLNHLSMQGQSPRLKPRLRAMQENLCNVSPDGDKITIAVPGQSGATQEITLSFNDASALVMTLPRLLKEAIIRKYTDPSLRNVYPVRGYVVECASDISSVLLTLAAGDGFDVVFGLDERMVAFLTRDLYGARDLLETRQPVRPH